MGLFHLIVSLICILSFRKKARVLAKVCGNLERVDVFWINLEKSVERRKYMERHLSHYGYDPTYRIRAVTAKDVTVPQEVSVAKDCSWTHNHTVNYVTSSAIFNSGRGGVKRVVTAPSTTTALTSSTSNVNRSVFKDMYKILITALCGRPRNSRRELVVTISHLMAIRAAIYSNTPSQYALILEDDVKIPFDIDFVQMAKQAPENFGVLQLVTSNDYDVAHLWKQYLKNPGNPNSIWKLRVEEDHWCAGAYLINKAVMKPFIDKILSELSNGWTGISVIAAYTDPCFPSKCCRNGKFNHLLNGCIKAPRGYQSDHFIFSIAQGRTYMITVPLITSASLGNSSTLHQDHVNMHHGAFNRINNCINDMRAGKVPFPKFVNTNCTY